MKNDKPKKPATNHRRRNEDKSRGGYEEAEPRLDTMTAQIVPIEEYESKLKSMKPAASIQTDQPAEPEPEERQLSILDEMRQAEQSK